MTDLKAKLTRQLDEFDLLFIPRMTLRNLTVGNYIPSRFIAWTKPQVAAIKDFLKEKHKPILACFGPINEPSDRATDLGPPGPDELERLFEDTGIKLGKQTILFNVESKALAERAPYFSSTGANVEVPPVDFDWSSEEALLPGNFGDEQPISAEPNPVRKSMRILGHKVDLRLRHPRPVYFRPPAGREQLFDPTIMMTNPAAWNEDRPFPTREPRCVTNRQRLVIQVSTGSKQNDRADFLSGVAVETSLPASWYEKGREPATIRPWPSSGTGGFLSVTNCHWSRRNFC